jgi:hypothetical protein
MPRRKPAKRASKRSSKNNYFDFASLHKMEKDFSAIPAKLTAKLDKAVSSLQRAETKLKKHINKVKTQLKHCETHVRAANKTKNTVAGRKQLSKIKKIHTEAMKTLITLNKELQETIKLHDMLSRKQAKFVALHRHLTQFEKNWTQSTKKRKSKKSNPTAKKTVKLVRHLPTALDSSGSEHSLEEIIGNMQPEEITEAMS